MVPQATTERLLLERLIELGGAVLRPKTLTSVVQDADGVTATFDDGDAIRARYVVGADGMHSTVREQAGIGFDGGAYERVVRARRRHDCAGDAPADEVILFWATAGLTVVAPLPGDVYRIVAPVDDAPEDPLPRSSSSCSTSAGPARAGWSSPTLSGARASASTTGSPTPTAPGGCCWPATRRTCTARRAGRA